MDIERKLLLIGGGGHCRSVLDCVLSAGEYKEIGIIDCDESASALDVPVIGTDEALPQLKGAGWTDAFISVGSVGNTNLRRKLYMMVKELGFAIPTIIDSSTIIARGTRIAEGVFIGKRVTVNSGAVIGRCAILNTGSVIEHDCKVGEFSHISPGTVLCGQVSVGNDTHVGAGSVICQGLRVGKNTLIGIGSVVVKDIPDGVKAFGNPCRMVE